MSVSTKRIERISKKHGVPINLAPGSDDVLNIGTKSMVKFHDIAVELAWDDELSHLKMVMAGNR